MRYLLLLLLALCVVSCTGATQLQAATANAIAQGANAALPILVDRYNQEGLRAIDSSKDRVEAEQAVARVKDRWFPVWNAWESLRIAEHYLAGIIESGGDPVAALLELKAAYCELRAVWPEDIPAMPLVPLIQCPAAGATP